MFKKTMFPVKTITKGSFSKYIICGLVSFVADYLVFFSMYKLLNIELYPSVLSGMVVGLLVGFILNKHWAFNLDSQILKTKMQFILFVSLFLFNSIFTYFTILVLKDFNIHEYVSKLIAMVCIVMWNYILYKKFIFRG